ncbi:Lsr2 family DNA-binding protein [Streptomyces echinatus]|uniref:Lsr2 family DNA-binding protein n=1 Tax=Streptomyces echinatus TaxID=67293 RepID=UPI003CD06E0F
MPPDHRRRPDLPQCPPCELPRCPRRLYKRLCDTYGPDVNAIRTWARANGYDVPPRCRLPAKVRAAWERGHPDG